MSADSRHTSATVAAASVAVLVALGALVLTSWLRGAGADTADDAARAPSTPPAEPERAVSVLRQWDRARAAAWAAGDPDALAELYVAGSGAGERDVAMLRRWSARGLRVRGMGMQVLQVEVRDRAERRLVLVVTDRLTGAVAVRESDGAQWTLPADRADTRRLVFRRTPEGWRLASSYDRPLARTAATSGSEGS